METGKNKATNNYVIALWSSKHYGEKHAKRDNIFRGQIRNVKTKEQKFFDNVAEFLTILQKWYKQDEVKNGSKTKERKRL